MTTDTAAERERLEFRHRLARLLCIDYRDLVAAGVIPDSDIGRGRWDAFQTDPFHWFLRVDDHTAAALWALIETPPRELP